MSNICPPESSEREREGERSTRMTRNANRLKEPSGA